MPYFTANVAYEVAVLLASHNHRRQLEKELMHRYVSNRRHSIPCLCRFLLPVLLEAESNIDVRATDTPPFLTVALNSDADCIVIATSKPEVNK